MLSRPAILLLSFVILLSDKRSLRATQIILALVRHHRGSTNNDRVTSQMCRQVFGRPKYTALYMCRVNFGTVWLSRHLHVSFCCVHPGTFSPWRLRNREADRCSLPTIAENRDERNEKWNVMMCQDDMRKRICVLTLPILPSVLDRFSWYPDDVDTIACWMIDNKRIWYLRKMKIRYEWEVSLKLQTLTLVKGYSHESSMELATSGRQC